MNDGPPEIAHIVGFDFRSVARCVREDLGWERLEKGVWLDEEGRHVHYLGRAEDLHGRPCGRLVYLVGPFDQREDWWRLDDAVRERGYERIYL